MMKKYLILLTLLFMQATFALTNEAYFSRFQQYRTWLNALPNDPHSQFISFISQDKPLSNKLRRLWLYHLAKQKKWSIFIQYYQPQTDITLKCLFGRALIETGQISKAIKLSKKLYLTSRSLPEACSPVIHSMKANGNLTSELILSRIQLALNDNQPTLARFLMNELQPHHPDASLLEAVTRQPLTIQQLTQSTLHSSLYLYGLKVLSLRQMPKAISLFQSYHAKQLLKPSEKQAFISHIALYKAIRNEKDALYWFNQIEPYYYTQNLLDWQIRFALRQQAWSTVASLTALPQNKKTPMWQYWHARALQKLNQPVLAMNLYKKISKERHYYGFLASLRQHQAPSFQNQSTFVSVNTLNAFKPLLNDIQLLYRSHHETEASAMLNDFTLELPTQEKIALIQWLSNTLGWYGKAVQLSSDKTLAHQLHIRFPIAHLNTVQSISKRYHIPTPYIYALIRQESAFKNEVKSFAGAIGLMQLMPGTAKLVAKSFHIPYRDKHDLVNIQTNISLGVAYLHDLKQHFRGNPILMAAAYNAGPRQVKRWLAQFPHQEWDIWIDTLPWHETRNYLKNIMAFYTVYQFQLNGKGKLSFESI
jgi:soluble lytic murein transglycosylase